MGHHPQKNHHHHQARRPKRLVVCCDGTWENALDDDGGVPPSNVTRLSRALRRTGGDGTPQVIYYHPGVGTGGLWLNSITGGAFGMGLSEDIREAYNVVCANYVDGDAIVLTGFSRGAFTARSVADLIASVGLLTPRGMAWFRSVFADYENMADAGRGSDEFLDDSYEALSPYDGSTGVGRIEWENRRKDEYRNWLKKRGWTRDTHRDGHTPIRVKAVAVWDTVGSLGIPPMPVVGIRGSARQWKFANTQVSAKVENAFQALSLDEPRGSFRPALWERLPDNTVTNLKQVWFPGSHADVGGGWHDQQIACITLAWICDQLTTVGVEFSRDRLGDLFQDTLRYGAAHPYPFVPSPSLFTPAWLWRLVLRARVPLAWATTPAPCPPPSPSQRADDADCTMKDRHPQGAPEKLWARGGRPWGLGQIRYPDSWVTVAAGTIVRRPGCFMRVDKATNADTEEPLLNTNERVHSSARVRLACGALGMDDRRAWTCPALQQDDSRHGGRPLWRLRRAGRQVEPQGTARDAAFWKGELTRHGEMYHVDDMYDVRKTDGQWEWVFEKDAVVRNGEGKDVTRKVDNHVLPEEPMAGYWERCLLATLKGSDDVWKLAQESTLVKDDLGSATTPRRIV